MRPWIRDALNPGVRPREVGAWALFDFANSGYTTVVLTAVFNAYFVGVVAGNADWATLAWTGALSVSYLIVMIAMPALGAWADARAAKKRLLLISTTGCVIATTALALVGPGDIWLAVVAIIVSNVAFSVGESIAGAFLPELARPEALGRVSGWGWSFGYLGGMLTLGLSLAVVLSSQEVGRGPADFVPITMLLTAGIFAVAALPVFVVLRERASPQRAPGGAAPVKGVFRQLFASWRDTKNFPDFRRLLICGVWYQAGIAVVITLAAIQNPMSAVAK
jgi:UMF1 family MFS transporter